MWECAIMKLTVMVGIPKSGKSTFMKQLSLFPTMLKSAYLSADSAKQAFYDISIVENTGEYFVVKRSGIKEDRVLDQRQWHFKNYEKAEKMFKRKLREKINPTNKRSRIYNILDYLW
jgi:hypothetical protein